MDLKQIGQPLYSFNAYSEKSWSRMQSMDHYNLAICEGVTNMLTHSGRLNSWLKKINRSS